MAVGELGEEVEQVAIGLNAVHPATADQDVEACLGPATLTVACVDFEQRFIPGSGWRSRSSWTRCEPGHCPGTAGSHPDGGASKPWTRWNRYVLGGEATEKGIQQWAGQVLTDGTAVCRCGAADRILDTVESGNAEECLVDDGRAILRLGLDRLSAPGMCSGSPVPKACRPFGGAWPNSCSHPQAEPLSRLTPALRTLWASSR